MQDVIASKIVIPDGIETIESEAFANGLFGEVTGLKNVSIIGNKAFSHCENLGSIDFTSDLKKLEKNSFEYCGHMQEVLLPEGVEKVCDGVFAHCPNLRMVYCKAAIDEFSDKAFHGDGETQDEDATRDDVIIHVNNETFGKSLEEKGFVVKYY